MTKTVLVLTGPMAAGKSPITSWFEEHKYQSFSLSDLVREKHGESDEDTTRHDQQNFANRYRQDHGADSFAQELAKSIDQSDSDRILVDGARNPAEIKFFRDHYNTAVIGITIHKDKQFEHIQKRARPSDPRDAEEVDAVRAREMGEGEPPEGQQVQACLDAADLLVENTGDQAAIVASIENFIRERGMPIE